jgi:succinate-semialdehyde dehydrogenase/glutarate-semialdehyde dehydrogenase
MTAASHISTNFSHPRGWATDARIDDLVRTVARQEKPDDTMVVRVAFTGEPLAVVPSCGVEDVAAAAARARSAQPGWEALGFRGRARVLRRFHDLLLARQDEVLDLLQLEAGKARKHAFEEVLGTSNAARYYANTAAHHLRDVRRRGAVPVLTKTIERHPARGLIGFIGPWNYPMILTIADILPAIAAGNAALLKPDSQTPLCALWAVELLREAGMPPELIQVATGRGSVVGSAIVDECDFVQFTGSSKTGREVAARASARLIDCSMELGGKNAMIVLDDVDVEKAVEGAIRACFANAGQLCLSVERAYVHDRVYDEFVERLAERTKQLVMHGQLDWTADMGSLISPAHCEMVAAYVDGAVQRGARIEAGGKARPDIGPAFYEPTVLTGLPETASCAREEIFGPVVAVERVATVEEAISRANDSAYGLSASVWSGSGRRGYRIAAQLQTGMVNVNEGWIATASSIDAPMGGFKASGIGRRNGHHGIAKYAESQTICVQRLAPMAAPPGVSEEKYAAILTTTQRGLRRLPFVK